MKSRSRHKPTQNCSALHCRLHKQEALCQKTHSCSPSSVCSHLEHIVAAEMAGETTYTHMMLRRRLSSLFTRADLPSSLLPFPRFLPNILHFFFTGVYTPDLLFALFLSERCGDGRKNGPRAKSLQLWWCECEEMGFTGMNLVSRVRLRVQTNKMRGKIFAPAC